MQIMETNIQMGLPYLHNNEQKIIKNTKTLYYSNIIFLS